MTADVQSKHFDKIILYQGSDLSICAFNCLIMKFAIKHNMTYDSIEDLLKLFQFICPKLNPVPSSIYKVKSFFEKYGVGTFSNKSYCTEHQKLKDDCECEQPDSRKISHLVNVSIEKPLQAILSGN